MHMSQGKMNKIRATNSSYELIYGFTTVSKELFRTHQVKKKLARKYNNDMIMKNVRITIMVSKNLKSYI